MSSALLEQVPMPAGVAKLPRDPRGYPVPWFVAWVDDKPDFRVMREEAIHEAIEGKRCWVCGERRLPDTGAYVAGPMCGVNRISSEPPSHLSCALYAVKVCPFLANAEMARNERALPKGATDPAGVMIRRNPGAVFVWEVREEPIYMRVPHGLAGAGHGILFRLQDPRRITWWANGREATREEVEHSIRTGLPTLMRAAHMDGPVAEAEAVANLANLLDLIPAT